MSICRFFVRVLCPVSFLLGLALQTWADEANRPKQADDPAAAEILAALDQRFSPVLHEVPLSEVVRRLRQGTGVNVLLDRKALEDVGLAVDTPITRELRDVSLRSFLNHVVRELKLTWIIENGALLITTRSEEQSRLVTRVYDVGDLLDVSEPKRDFEEAGGAPSNVPHFCGSYLREPFEDPQLVRLIISIVQRGSWHTVGGPGSIEVFNKKLVVSQTRRIHRQVEMLLEALRDGLEFAKNGADPARLWLLVSDEDIELSGAHSRVIAPN